MRTLSILSLLLALGGCRNVAAPGTYFDSRPAGAEVLVDGRKSGYVTPCTIALNRSRDHRISFQLPGYELRAMELETGDQTSWIPLRDGASSPNGSHFPLWLQAHELFLPRINDDSLVPGRIFVRLQPLRK